MFIKSFSNSFSTPLKDYQKQRNDLIQERYNHIYNHEMAHKIAGGSFAGSISVEKDSNGIPVSGHVPIQMPILDKKNLRNELHSLTSSSRFVFRFLTVLPFAFVLIIFILNPSYFDPFFETNLGLVLLFVIIIMFAIYIWVLQKVLKVKV